MIPLERHLYDVVKKYSARHGRNPKSISVGVDIYYQMMDFIHFAPLTMIAQQRKGLAAALFWNGLPVKVVKRKNYIEVMPRMKGVRRAQFVKMTQAEPWYYHYCQGDSKRI